MHKVFLVIPSLKAGGAERVMSFLANNINSEKFQIHLVVIGFPENSVYNFEYSKTIFLNKHRVRQGIFPLIQLIIREKPVLVMSSLAHLNNIVSFLSFFLRKTSFIVREANIDRIRSTFNDVKSKKGLSINFKKWFYPSLRYIICQSEDMYDAFVQEHPHLKEKVKIINNPVNDDFKLKQGSAKERNKRLITVGALHKRKGHLRLLSSVSQLTFPFEYVIIGDGPEKQVLMDYAVELGILQHIQFISFTKEVARYLSQSDFFLQGSFVEGFPNAVIESCAVGTPVIAFEAPGGLNEIILNGKNGHVFKTETEFINGLEHYAETPTFIPSEVRDIVIKKFGKNKILQHYEQLFLESI